MVAAAGLLVLVGLAAFVAGLATDSTALYWGCVAASALAAVLLVLARVARGRADGPAEEVRDDARRMPPEEDGPPVARPGERDRPAVEDPAAGEHHRSGQEPAPGPAEGPPADDAGPQPTSPGVPPAVEPAEEDVEFADLLLVMDLADEVLVVDEHPRYHRAGCPRLTGSTAVPLPVGEARADGFTPCGTCRPVRHLAGTERSRRRAAHLD